MKLKKLGRFLTPLLSVFVVLLVALAALSATSSALTESPAKQPVTEPSPIYNEDGTIDIGPVVRNKEFPLRTEGAQQLLELARAQSVEYSEGDDRIFLGLDNAQGFYFLTTYEVRLISDTVEVWVQKDLNYYNLDGSLNPIHPDANDPAYVTQARVEALAGRFQEDILPTDVEYFGDYMNRDGSGAALPGLVGLPEDYFTTDNGKRVIILVSNVRDGNFYDPANNPSFIAGFYSPTINDFAGRNIITIDSKQWNERVGPPDFGYDATIAHEFQHLINGDWDNDEESWANEGRSEFAEFLVGYRPDADSHRTTWSDFPENSLTLWGDQDNDPDQPFEILADYQTAYWFFLYLAGRMDEAGVDSIDNILKDISLTTKDDQNGIASIDAMLDDVGAPFDFIDVWSDFRSDMLYGGDSDGTAWGDYISAYAPPSGVPIAPLDLGRMRRNLDFEGYDTPGAPPYGSDYIEIGWSNAITPDTTLDFNGQVEIPTDWQEMAADDVEIAPTGNVTGNVLYSGHSDLTDNFVIFEATVPSSGDQMLAFDTLYDIEATWDFGFVQVTTDTTGATGFASLDVTGTVTETNANAHPIIQANVPGFSGVSGTNGPAWVHVEHDLSAYAGENILLAFRYSTDGAAAGNGVLDNPGWYLDNISVGGTDLFTDSLPSSAMSIWQARNKAYSFALNFVTFADGNGADINAVYTTTLTAGSGTFDLGDLLGDAGFDEAGERTVALVSSIAPESDDDIIGMPGYGSYTLTGLPPSVLTSRARMIGTAADSTTLRPRVYPGDAFSVTVTVDNLGRNDDLSAAPGDAYVAVPIPANTSFVSGTANVDVAPGNIQYTNDLSSLEGALPAVPGVFWNGTVSETADLSFDLQVMAPLTIGTMITPTAHIANGPFTTATQYFTDVEQAVEVVSPLAFSKASSQTDPAPVLDTATFEYTLVNTDDQARDVDFRFTIPDGTELAGIRVGTEQLARAAQIEQDVVNLTLSVPSYLNTGEAKVVTVELLLLQDFTGTSLTLVPEVLQPNSDIPYTELDVDAVEVWQNRVLLPVIVNLSE